MSFLWSNNKCLKFYTYSTRKLNIQGISAQLNRLDVTSSVGVGAIDINPQFVLASDELQRLDLLQFTICGQINQLDKHNPERDRLRVEYIKTLTEMLSIAQNPSAARDTSNKNTGVLQDKKTFAADPQNKLDAPDIKQSIKTLIEEDKIRLALNELRKVSANQTLTLLLAQYTSIEVKMVKGLLKNTDFEYKDYISRLNDYVDLYL